MSVFVARTIDTFVTPGTSRDLLTICAAHGLHMSSTISMESSSSPIARSVEGAVASRTCGAGRSAAGSAAAGWPHAINRAVKRTSAGRTSIIVRPALSQLGRGRLPRGLGAVLLLGDVVLEVTDAFFDVTLCLVGLAAPLGGAIAYELAGLFLDLAFALVPLAFGLVFHVVLLVRVTIIWRQDRCRATVTALLRGSLLQHGDRGARPREE